MTVPEEAFDLIDAAVAKERQDKYAWIRAAYLQGDHDGAAAERARIRQVANDVGATYECVAHRSEAPYETHSALFADLIGES